MAFYVIELTKCDIIALILFAHRKCLLVLIEKLNYVLRR